MRANALERRRQAYLRRIPEPYGSMECWPSVDANSVDEELRPRLLRLTKAATLFLKEQSMADVLAVAEVGYRQFFELMDHALAPRKDSPEINGTRAFVRHAVQGPRTRVMPHDSNDGAQGLGGMFGMLLREHPQIGKELIAFLNGKERPNKVTPHVLQVKFLKICTTCGVPAADYPFCTKSKGYRPLQKWFQQVYLPLHLLTHVRRQHGPDAAKAAAYETGDGQTQTPPTPYAVWVIDECQIDLDAVIQLPMARWDVEYVEIRKFPLLRCRSIGQIACNIAWHMCLAPQASGPDVIQLFRNAVLGQPAVEPIEPTMTYEEGAGFPQNIFPGLKLHVPLLVHLDNALAHLYNPLQHLLIRLYGGRVILGVPGAPKGRPDIESSISHLLCDVIHQLPNTSGTGPQDPLRDQSKATPEKSVPVGLIEQVLDVYFANQNVLASAGAGYLDSFTRLARMVGAGQIKCNYLPEGRRRPHHFCEPTPVKIHCNLAAGRLPYVNFLHRRYSSPWLKTQPALGNTDRELYALADYDDLRTLVIVDHQGADFAVLTVEGAWARVPHDLRMIKIYGKRKSDAQFQTRPGDSPLFGTLTFLADRAKSDRQAAQEYAYIMRYLKRHLPPEALTGVMDADFEAPSAVAEEEVAVPSARAVGASPPSRARPEPPAPRKPLLGFTAPRRLS